VAKQGRTSSIKYADKSEGQPELVQVFASLRKLISKYEKGNYRVKDDLPGNYSLFYDKEAHIKERIYPDLPFAAILVQTGYVGFYFFCVYTNPELRKELSPDLLKHLKGKTCFHIKKADDALIGHIDDALKKGYRIYASNGWK
jgi:hypothetical protein